MLDKDYHMAQQLMDQMWYTHTMDYYSEVLIHAAIGINLEIIMLSERIQAWKPIDCVITLIINNRNRQTHRDRNRKEINGSLGMREKEMRSRCIKR